MRDCADAIGVIGYLFHFTFTSCFQLYKLENLIQESRTCLFKSQKMKNQIDIDAIIKNVNEWDKHTERLSQENADLKRRISILEKQSDLSARSEAQARDELKQLRKVILVMQDTIDMQSTVKEESAKVKKEIRHQKEVEARLRKAMKEKEFEAWEKYQVMEELNVREVERMKNEFDTQMESSSLVMQRAVQERDKIVDKLQKQNMEMQREKEHEMMMFRLEYEERLQQLSSQRQWSIEAQSNQESVTLKNEKLKKTLYRMEAEAEREIVGLKRKITEMEREKAIDKHQGQKRKKLTFL